MEERKPIRTVIFDIGGVLTRYEERNYFVKLGYPEEMVERLYRATMKSGYWEEYDKGILTDEEVLRCFQKCDPEIADTIAESMKNIKGLVCRYEGAIPWIQSVKESGRLVLVLSNFSAKAFHDCAEAMDFLPYTDGGILSYRDHVVKPNPLIYELIIERYGLNPEECIFIDDTQLNLTAAAEHGLQTLLCTSPEEAEETLKSYFAQAPITAN